MLAVTAAVVSPLTGAMLGNPGKVAAEGQTTLGAVLNFGSRELEVERGPSGDVDITGLSLELRRGITPELEVFGRMIPNTTEWDFDDSELSPSVFSLGGGCRWVPDNQREDLKWGMGFGIDWGEGDENEVDLSFLEKPIRRITQHV